MDIDNWFDFILVCGVGSVLMVLVFSIIEFAKSLFNKDIGPNKNELKNG